MLINSQSGADGRPSKYTVVAVYPRSYPEYVGEFSDLQEAWRDFGRCCEEFGAVREVCPAHYVNERTLYSVKLLEKN